MCRARSLTLIHLLLAKDQPAAVLFSSLDSPSVLFISAADPFFQTQCRSFPPSCQSSYKNQLQSLFYAR